MSKKPVPVKPPVIELTPAAYVGLAEKPAKEI